MTAFKRFSLVMFVLVFIGSVIAVAGDIKSAGKKGLWSADSTWVGGVKPNATDNVIIAAGDSVGVDTSFAIASLTVGEATGSASRLRLNGTRPVILTITGNLTIMTSSVLAISSSTWDDPNVAGTTNEIVDTLYLSGNFTSSGVFDFSTGTAGSSKHNVRLIFVGSTTSTVTCGAYVPTSTNEFAGITFRKTGGARVVLANDIIAYGGSSGSAANVNPFIYFEGGLVDATAGTLISVWTDGNVYKGFSDTSYVIGAIGRGVNNGGGITTKVFPVGDVNGYRPVTLRFNAPSNVTGHYVKVTAVRGDAATVTATLGSGIDKVASVRYYKVELGKATGTGAFATMTMTNYTLPYRATDGVAAGNTNLRVAVCDTVAPRTWKAAGPALVAYTTRLDTTASITSDSVAATINMFGAPLYVALARATGSTENTLTGTGTSVEQVNNVPGTWSLLSNYPNPFNPSTTISYVLGSTSAVSLKVYDVLGKEVATLVNGVENAGNHAVRFDAGSLTSGIYFYRLQVAGTLEVGKMLLMK